MRQLNFLDLTDGSMNDAHNDPVPDFNWYIGRADAKNPIEWTHTWSLATPSAGNIPLDPDEVYSSMMAAEIFPVIWDIDYPSSTENDQLFWDKIAYAGPTGAAFSMAANPAANSLGRMQGNDSIWGAKRISLDTTKLPQGGTEYFWLQVDKDAAPPDWMTSIDYSDLAIIFNPGQLAIDKQATVVSGFDPPRVGYTTIYRMRINISNPTLSSTGGPMYDVAVTDKFPAGSTIVTNPQLGSAAIDAAGNLTWNVGILQDGALNGPPAAGSADFMEVLVTVTPTQAMVGAPFVLNNGATITGDQTPLDPGDGTGTLYPFNFHAMAANHAQSVSVQIVTPGVAAAHGGALAVTPSIRPGATITVTVTDDDLNTNAASAETAAILLRDQTTGETETVNCTETGPNTGIFMGTLATIFGTAAGPNGNGIMTVQAADTVRATYNDLVNAAGVSTVITADTAVTGGSTGVLAATTPITPGASAVVTLADADLNANPAAAESISLTTVNVRTGEQELLTYVETGANTGIFAATLATAFGNAANANNNGTMNCISGDSLTTQYNDTFTANGGQSTTTATSIVNGGQNGTLNSDATVAPGGQFHAVLVDSDLNTNPAAANTFLLRFTDTTTGEFENIVMTESGPNTGVFTGTINTVYGQAAGPDNDGVFEVAAGHALTAVYNDALTATGAAGSVSATTMVIGGHDSAISATAAILPGAGVTITLTDADLNTNAVAVDFHTLATTNSVTGESELLTYTETGVNTGVFTTTAGTAFGAAAGANNDGIFNVQAGHLLRTSYNDAFTANGGTAVLTATTSVTGGNSGTITVTATIAPGDRITCTVNDPDLNTVPAAVQTIVVSALNTISGERDNVTLTETGPSTGIFTGSAGSTYSVAALADNDGTFGVVGGQTIRFTYLDALSALGGPSTVTGTSTVLDDSNSVTITSPAGTYTSATHNVTGNTDQLSHLTMNDPITGGILSTTADISGNYTFAAVTFPEGVTTFTVTSIDPAGNHAVAASSVLIDTKNTISVSDPSSNSTVNTPKSDVTGTTDPGSTVTLTEPSTNNILTTTADSSGKFTFPDVGISAGANTLHFSSTDPHGNVATTNTTVTLDPDIILEINSISDSATYTSNQLPLSGTTDPFSNLTTTNPQTGAVLSTTADASGNYTLGTLTFTDGAHTATVNSTDPAGNTTSATVSFNVDTSNTNNIITAGTFASTTINITGNTNPFSTVTMPHPLSGELLTCTADAGGNYVFQGVFMTDGAYTVTTTSRDPFGNTAVDSSNIVIDSSITLSVFLPQDRSVITSNMIDIHGKTDPFAHVTFTEPATDIQRNVTADANGDFVFTNVSMNNGDNFMTFVATDDVGNSASHNHTLIYNPDLGILINTITNGEVVRDGVQTLGGITAPGATVTTTNPANGQTLTTTADAFGAFVFPDITFPTGADTVTATATTPDGHTVSTSVTLIVANVGVDGQLLASERTVFGYAIIIEVTDRESYLDPNSTDTLKVVVTNPSTSDSEVRTLVETAPDSGIFRGLMNTVERAASDGINSGSLSVRYGDTVTTTYMDIIRADGSLNTPITARTLITNDELKVQVHIISVTGEVSIEPLRDSNISILEFDPQDKLSGNVSNFTTNGDGNIPTSFVSYMHRGYHYRVLMNELRNGFPYSRSEEFGLENIEGISPDNRGVRTMVVTLDPAGYVYDAVTGARINGADVSLRHQDGTPVAGRFTFYSSNPSAMQTNPQLSGDSGIPGGFEFIGDATGSDLAAGNYYITVTFGTNPALGNTYSPIILNPGAWAGIQQPYTGQVFRVDQANQPIGMKVPLLSSSNQTPLLIDKISDKDAAALGDIVTFTVTVRNLANAATDPDSPVTVKDTLPVGLTYIDGSTTLKDGTHPAARKSAGGVIYFDIGRLQAAGDANGNDSAVLYYQASVNSATRPGLFLTNSAVAMINLIELSNRDSATVRVAADPILDEATLIGKVFEDRNGNGIQDNGEPGIAGAGILLDDGTYVKTDKKGKYSVPGAQPGMETTGLRAVKIDMRTLPAGTALTTPEAVFATLRPGGMDKIDFGVSTHITGDAAAPAKKDRLSLITFDAAAGEIESGYSNVTRPDIDAIPEGGYTKSRIAYFYTGKISSAFTLTSAYDSHKPHTFDISPDRNRDLYYPTYGDSSKASYLANMQGILFVELKSLSSKLLVGNYSGGFAETELAGLQRALSGAVYEFNKPSADTAGATNRMTSFASKRKQLLARSEFRSTGGTRYRLAHSKIVPGSESITVEIRDAFIPEKVVSARALKYGEDYEIDYITGGVRLLSPVADYAPNDYLNKDGIGGDNPIWITAEYLYSPDSAEYGVFGARALGWLSGVGFGASFLHENIDNRDHVLQGADLHIRRGGGEVFKAEWAQSESGGEPWFASLDGGSSFVELGQRTAKAGTAYKINWKIKAIRNLAWENYYYSIDPGFNGGDFSEKGIRRAGSSATYKLNNNAFTVDYTDAVSLADASNGAILNASGGMTKAYRAAFKHTFHTSSYEFEFQHRHSSSQMISNGLPTGTADSFAFRYERKMTERIEMSFRQQASLTPRDNFQSTLGVKYKMWKDFDFIAETTVGTNGTGGKIGFEKRAGANGKAYAGISSGYSPEYGTDRISTTAGYSGKISNNSNAYMEYEGTSQGAEQIARRTLGLNQKYDLGNHGFMSMSLERSQEKSSLQGPYYSNNINVAFEYTTPKKVSLKTDTEFRRQKGSINKELFGFHFLADGEPRTDYHMFFEYAYDVTDDLIANRADSKYTKAVLGLAVRPTNDDRFNLLSKVGRVRELRTLALNDALNPDTISTVMSIEGIYQFSASLRMNEKIASKMIEELVSPLPLAKTHTILWINGLKWQPPRSKFDFSAEYRATHQPTQKNQKNGAAVETGYTLKNQVRMGVGYNFSSFSDDEFAATDHSYRGVFFRLQGKF